MYLIIGCGRLGASLATKLSSQGDQVVIIDHLRENLHHNLPRDFRGKTICGMEIDTDVLRRAGIERADSVICVSRDENTNMMAADVARRIYGAKSVVVRIDHPRYVAEYQANGFDVISPILEATNSLERALKRRDGETP